MQASPSNSSNNDSAIAIILLASLVLSFSSLRLVAPSSRRDTVRSAPVRERLPEGSADSLSSPRLVVASFVGCFAGWHGGRCGCLGEALTVGFGLILGRCRNPLLRWFVLERRSCPWSLVGVADRLWLTVVPCSGSTALFVSRIRLNDRLLVRERPPERTLARVPRFFHSRLTSQPVIVVCMQSVPVVLWVGGTTRG